MTFYESMFTQRAARTPPGLKARTVGMGLLVDFALLSCWEIIPLHFLFKAVLSDSDDFLWLEL